MRRRIDNHKLKSEITNTRPQRGYMLITLMLLMALAAMALLAVLPDTVQQIRRDREEEMCHRGTQYMRAIQHFYKKVWTLSDAGRGTGKHQQHPISSASAIRIR